MRRAIMMTAIVAALAGCAEKPPTFKNDPEELRYLDALSNPTPDQRTRRQALREKYKPGGSKTGAGQGQEPLPHGS